MGSSGVDRINHYQPTADSGAGGPGGQEGGITQDRCDRAFSVNLEDVEHSDHYLRTSEPASVDTQLTIELRKRIVAVSETGESVGNLPTSLNYLAECLADGFRYAGVVTTSTPGAEAVLAADFVVSP